MRSFKHSGDIGDIIYALPAMRVAGGGDLFLSKATFTRTLISKETLANVAPLLELQSYVQSVKLYHGQSVAFDLDQFRFVGTAVENIAERTLLAFGFPVSEASYQWLVAADCNDVAPVVINMTCRYRNLNFPWRQVVQKYREKCVFVGTNEEHRNFITCYGNVPFYKTPTLLDLANVINGCSLFIGNQSTPYAIAEALKKPVIQEVCLGIHNCMFDRKDAQYVAGKRITLPDL